MPSQRVPDAAAKPFKNQLFALLVTLHPQSRPITAPFHAVSNPYS